MRKYFNTANGPIIDREKIDSDAYKEYLAASQVTSSSPSNVADTGSESPILLRYDILGRYGWYDGEEEPSEVHSDVANFVSVNLHFERSESKSNMNTLKYWSFSFRLEMPFLAKSDEFRGLDNVNLLKIWLDTCRNTHSTCRPSYLKDDESDGWRPSRLIKLPDRNEPHQKLWLCEASHGDYSCNVEYIALSHRWATQKQLLLRRSNRKRLRKTIPKTRLKASIRDAVSIAACLDVRYLWIDTLCIIQDSDTDRDYEISQMDKVYSRSLLTIAASDASCDDEGCFLRHEIDVNTYPVLLHSENLGDVRHLVVYTEEWDNDPVSKSVLAGRAWVFQERLLSPRTVHCCKEQFHWECRTLEASESQPNGPNSSLLRFRSPPCKAIIAAELPEPYRSDSPNAMSQLQKGWRRIVQDYSDGKLTYAEDKLRALAGVQAVWLRQNQDEYIAGHWRSTLLSDLCWSPVVEKGNNCRLRGDDSMKYIAPSWSWASVQVPVRFNVLINLGGLGVDDDTLQLTGIERTTVAKSAFDIPRVTDGGNPPDAVNPEYVLHLRGRPVKATYGLPPPGDALGRVRLFLCESSEGSAEKEEDSHDGQWEDGLDYVDFDDAPEPSQTQIFCLPLVIDDTTNALDVYDIASCGIVLVPIPGKEMHFRRVGMFQSHREGSFNTTMENLAIL